MLILTWDEHVCGVHLGLIFGGGRLPVEEPADSSTAGEGVPTTAYLSRSQRELPYRANESTLLSVGRVHGVGSLPGRSVFVTEIEHNGHKALKGLENWSNSTVFIRWCSRP